MAKTALLASLLLLTCSILNAIKPRNTQTSSKSMPTKASTSMGSTWSEWTEVGKGACRTEAGDQGESHTVKQGSTCRDECGAFGECLGYEEGQGSNTCELQWQRPTKIQAAPPGYTQECWRKDRFATIYTDLGKGTCRTASGGQGATTTISSIGVYGSCWEYCDYLGSSCKGYETEGQGCEAQHEVPTQIGSVTSNYNKQCFRKDTFELMGQGSCRTASGGLGKTHTTGRLNEKDCLERCAADPLCVGIETGSMHLSCELHFEAVVQTDKLVSTVDQKCWSKV